MHHQVLIVEDNAVMANLLQFNLKRAGFGTVVATNGDRALQLATESQFDVVITDHQMPGMPGVELCKRLREMPAYQTTPLLLCTAKGLELPREALLEDFGITDLIFKPVSPRQLVLTVQSLLSPVTSG